VLWEEVKRRERGGGAAEQPARGEAK